MTPALRPLPAPLLLLLATACAAGAPAPQAPYKCIFNHELLIATQTERNSPAHMASFISKLAGTDVDAVMCCPTMWRANLYPSRIDTQWKKYASGQPLSKFKGFDFAMRYIAAGGDPVKETRDACRKHKKAFFINYRMNDSHYIDDLSWPTHNFFWRENPSYWLGDTTEPPTRSDRVRLMNYMLPQVRDYYFSIIEELCTQYAVDGAELDFQRFPRFFRDADLAEGRKVMTAFVKRIRDMLDKLGRSRGTRLWLSVRVPETLAKCEKAGLDIPVWDALGLVDMVNVSSSYFHTMELGIEEFKAQTRRAKVYGEMNYVTAQNSAVSKFARRYTVLPVYYASALNLFSRGADGLSLFNFDYAPAPHRASLNAGLRDITDLEFLKAQPKDYVVYPNFGTFPAKNEKTLEIVIPDDVSKVRFDRALLRLETRERTPGAQIQVTLNGRALFPIQHATTELFPPLAQNEGYAPREALTFYTVPLPTLVPGTNRIELKNAGKELRTFLSLELALYR